MARLFSRRAAFLVANARISAGLAQGFDRSRIAEIDRGGVQKRTETERVHRVYMGASPHQNRYDGGVVGDHSPVDEIDAGGLRQSRNCSRRNELLNHIRVPESHRSGEWRIGLRGRRWIGAARQKQFDTFE